MAGCQLLAGELLVIDRQAELDELFKKTATFVKSVELKVEVPSVPPRSIVEPVASRPVAKSSGSEREEIVKRVASFRAHQQRLIREREAYAASVLVGLKASAQS
jgi:hypothetical protein